MNAAWSVTGLVLFAIALVLLVIWRPRMLGRRSGKVLAFMALFLVPALASTLGAGLHLEKAKTTEFCLSCHEMQPYGESLMLDDSEYLPAAHFQNHRVPADSACYSCHTDYTMFGGVNAKMRGMRHLWVHYVGKAPEKLALYEPYNNRECLHCHGGARSFEESELHGDIRSELASGEMSCLECHDAVHPVDKLDSLERWQKPSTEGES
jgi:cytochrome c-type protein NapC